MFLPPLGIYYNPLNTIPLSVNFQLFHPNAKYLQPKYVKFWTRICGSLSLPFALGAVASDASQECYQRARYIVGYFNLPNETRNIHFLFRGGPWEVEGEGLSINRFLRALFLAGGPSREVEGLAGERLSINCLLVLATWISVEEQTRKSSMCFWLSECFNKNWNWSSCMDPSSKTWLKRDFRIKVDVILLPKSIRFVRMLLTSVELRGVPFPDVKTVAHVPPLTTFDMKHSMNRFNRRKVESAMATCDLHTSPWFYVGGYVWPFALAGGPRRHL